MTIPEDQIDLIEDLMESLGWSILASEVARELLIEKRKPDENSKC